MALKKEISERMKTYMREKKTTELTVIRQIKNEIMKYETSGAGKEADDAEITKILNALVKQHQESIDIYTKNAREDLLEKEVLELEIIRSLLPEELSETLIEKIVLDAIASTGASSAKDMGSVMKTVKEAIAATGKSSDGRLVADIVKKNLN